MTDSILDTSRALAAAKAVFDSRDPATQSGKVFVTLEHTVAVILLALGDGDPAWAAKMLNEAVVPGVEERLAYYNAKKRKTT